MKSAGPETPSKFLWLDMEMTGLEPLNGDRILEVAALVSDVALAELEFYHSLVKHDDESEVIQLLQRNPFWASRSEGLQQIVVEMADGKPQAEVEMDLLSLAGRHFKPNEPIYLAGNTIRLDRSFIDQYMPELASRLHYRMLDVSSIKVWWTANGKPEYKKQEKHRALDDIRESIAELKHYTKDIDFGNHA